MPIKIKKGLDVFLLIRSIDPVGGEQRVTVHDLSGEEEYTSPKSSSIVAQYHFHEHEHAHLGATVAFLAWLTEVP